MCACVGDCGWLKRGCRLGQARSGLRHKAGLGSPKVVPVHNTIHLDFYLRCRRGIQFCEATGTVE